MIPSSKWGGKGLLGAQIGRGYLHRLPKDCRNTFGVSFERKVCVDENNTTSCGAVDLKLNGSSKICDNQSNDIERKETIQKKTQIFKPGFSHKLPLIGMSIAGAIIQDAIECFPGQHAAQCL